MIRSDLDSLQEPPSDLDDLTLDALANIPAPGQDLEALAEKLRSGDAQWWDARVASRLLATEHNEPLANALEAHQSSDRRLFLRILAANGIVWLLSIIGLAFIPHTIRVIRSGWTIASLHRPVRYGSRWEPSLVIALFLAGDLLANAFIFSAYFATAYVDTGFVYDVIVDAAWRLLAPALALVVLFRKPSHAIRSLGLDTNPSWKVILATFAFLSWLQYGYYLLIEPWSDSDPTGGLDMMENGWGGLVYGLLSACILAPIAEEIFYRGLLLRGLERRFGFWISASVVTLAFALAHTYDTFGLISVGMVGFTLVVVYRTTGSLTTVIMIHALYNLAITVPTWLLFHAKF
jgi:membrane protease YdiL (CAAX protease family)